MHNLQTFEVYQNALKLKRNCFKLVLPLDYKQSILTYDIVKTVKSVSANLAEGHGRYSYQEFIRFCRISRGSAYELIDHLDSLLVAEIIDKQTFQSLENEIISLIKRINGYIRYLKSQK
ncbi:four helix bundle protein [Fischerella sp.]|uniref:four helix bundle protein n=1 Tax=Fischerella sp. TaxID=1191 RepID=UPI00345BECE6